MKRLVVGALVLLSGAFLAGCGPNDRIRDTYWGKGEDYQPVEHNEYGEPILKDEPSENGQED